MTHSLETIQQMFADALHDARDEPALLEQLSSSGSDARQRLQLYEGQARAHWLAALANAYPVLNALVGDAYFEALSTAYARAHPSQSGDLNVFGAQIAAFVETYERDPQFGYLTDIAQLEWALHTGWFAADPAVISLQQWHDMDSERLLDARLSVHPACTAVTSQYAVAEIWFAHQPGGRFPARLATPTWTLVVRPQWKPTLLVQSAAAHAAFIALQQRHTLNEALDAAFAVDAEFDVQSQLSSWIETHAVTGVVVD